MIYQIWFNRNTVNTQINGAEHGMESTLFEVAASILTDKLEDLEDSAEYSHCAIHFVIQTSQFYCRANFPTLS